MRFLSLLLLILVLHSCGRRETLVVAESDPGLDYQDGSVVYKGKIFCGIIFRLHDCKGDTAYRAVYVQGMRHGCERFWCAPHQLCEERLYKNGLLDGVQRQWYSNGRSKAICSYTENILDGKFMEWSERGVLQKELMYKDGLEHGLQKGWDDHGELLYSYEAVNDR